MQNQFLEFGLLLSDWKFITTILIVSYLFVDKESFAMAICLQVFAISFNAYMKTVFKIPLNPEIFLIKQGWAFPSGHTQSLTSMLIYICWHYRKLWVILGSVIILIYAVISIEYFLQSILQCSSFNFQEKSYINLYRSLLNRFCSLNLRYVCCFYSKSLFHSAISSFSHFAYLFLNLSFLTQTHL